MEITKMTEDDYITLAMRTAKPQLAEEAHLIHAGLGIGSEVGELADALSREYHGLPQEDGHTTFLAAAIIECGDILWFTSLLINTLAARCHFAQRKSFTQILATRLPLPDKSGVYSRALHLNDELLSTYPTVLHLKDRRRAAAHAFLPMVVQTSGDVLTLIKKECVYGEEVSEYELHKAIVELWRAVTVYYTGALGVDFDTVANKNIEKLRKRYPDVYTDEFALARLDTTK